MTPQKLRELFTPDFLSTLHAAVECYGWSGDMVETANFCDWCHNMAGRSEQLYDMEAGMEPVEK
jgi:hypothetical protein